MPLRVTTKDENFGMFYVRLAGKVELLWCREPKE